MHQLKVRTKQEITSTEIRQSDLITSHFEKRPASKVVEFPINYTPVRRQSLKSRIGSAIMRRLDKWADSISQETFDNIMSAILGIVVLGFILLAGHLEYLDHVDHYGK